MADGICTTSAMEEEGKFLHEVCSVLRTVGSNLNNFVVDCSTDGALVKSDCDDAEAELVSKTIFLKDDVVSLLGPVTAVKMGEADKFNKVQTRYDQLHKQWLDQQDQLGRAQDEILRLRNQVMIELEKILRKTTQELLKESLRVMHQSTFCASLGAILGNLVWQASRFPDVTDMWLSMSKIGEFLCIVNGTFVSFINTYGSVFPPETSDESQFVMGLCGIVTNLSASPEGRQFLVSHPNGKDLLKKLVELMPTVPLPTGTSLTRLILMILYNVSINRAGLRYLMELRVCRVLDRYINESASTDLKQLCLRLLQSITYKLEDESTIADIIAIVTTKRIEELSRTEPENLAAIAKKVSSNLQKSQLTLERKGLSVRGDQLDFRFE